MCLLLNKMYFLWVLVDGTFTTEWGTEEEVRLKGDGVMENWEGGVWSMGVKTSGVIKQLSDTSAPWTAEIISRPSQLHSWGGLLKGWTHRDIQYRYKPRPVCGCVHTCEELTRRRLSLHQSIHNTLFPCPFNMRRVFMLNAPSTSTFSATWLTDTHTDTHT